MSTLNRSGFFKPRPKSGAPKRSLPLPAPGMAPGTGTAKCTETQMASGSLCVCVSTVSSSPLGSVTWAGASSADNRLQGWEGVEMLEPPHGPRVPLADNEGRDP